MTFNPAAFTAPRGTPLKVFPELPFLTPQMYGAVADGTTDNTTALRAVIAAAETLNISTIFFPPGIYKVTSKIVNVGQLPNGLTFLGGGRMNGDSAVTSAGSTVIQYTGTDYCWDIRNPLGTSTVGGWEWDNIVFQTTSVLGNMFSINYLDLSGVDYVPTDTASTPYYVEQVSFKRCKFLGQGGATQAGSAIRAKKCFELSVDEHCLFRDWKRGVHINGCDNSTLSGRYTLNARNIMIEHSGTFGNNNLCTPRFLGFAPAVSLETRYLFYDTGKGTTLISPMLEDTDATVTALYIGGFGFTCIAPYFSNTGKMFELSLDALRCSITNPVIPVGGGAGGITVATPASWEFGLESTAYYLTVSGAPARFWSLFVPNPRVVLDTSLGGFNTGIGPGQVMSTGPIFNRYFYDPLHFQNSIWTGRIAATTGVTIEADATTQTGWRVLFTPSVNNLWVPQSFICGTHFKNGDVITARVNYHSNGAIGSGAFNYLFRKNNVDANTGTFPAHTGAYTTETVSYTTSGFVTGDELTLNIVGASTNVAVYVSAVEITLSPVAISDLTVPGSFADLAAVQTYLNGTLVPAINATQGKVRTII